MTERLAVISAAERKPFCSTEIARSINRAMAGMSAVSAQRKLNIALLRDIFTQTSMTSGRTVAIDTTD
ncbi:hypothetical protein [Sphingomonas zeae]|jgi:hypothetical protein|uniref:hypothetical protein n=1 Tax=Sphingomonas zeae TaxID=1646122 RepID=UPI00185874F7|nr:hypothetical protein [Sphingomonas zeae]MBB4049784.1 hypothetical protein [Sphingomonas zeae]MDK8185747.1 hypothetical protein [Sphingomonas zeae]